VSTIEQLLGRKSSGSGLENREYGRRDPSRWPRGTLYLQKLALTSPTSSGRLVGIISFRTQATEFSISTDTRTNIYMAHNMIIAGISMFQRKQILKCSSIDYGLLSRCYLQYKAWYVTDTRIHVIAANSQRSTCPSGIESHPITAFVVILRKIDANIFF
jgi:hypothetical protein